MPLAREALRGVSDQGKQTADGGERLCGEHRRHHHTYSRVETVTPELDTIVLAAERILNADPDPVVRFRLLRDVFNHPPDSEELEEASEWLETSGWVCQLDDEQWTDGSWGRLPSRDSGARQKIPNTEACLAMALGATGRGWTVGLWASSQLCLFATLRELAPTHGKAMRLYDACPASTAALPSRPVRTFRHTCLCYVWERLIRVLQRARGKMAGHLALRRIDFRNSGIHIPEARRAGLLLDSRRGTSTWWC